MNLCLEFVWVDCILTRLDWLSWPACREGGEAFGEIKVGVYSKELSQFLLTGGQGENSFVALKPSGLLSISNISRYCMNSTPPKMPSFVCKMCCEVLSVGKWCFEINVFEWMAHKEQSPSSRQPCTGPEGQKENRNSWQRLSRRSTRSPSCITG